MRIAPSIALFLALALSAMPVMSQESTKPQPKSEPKPQPVSPPAPEPEPKRPPAPVHAAAPGKLQQTCYGADRGLAGGRLCVSSVLDPQFGNRYGGSNMLDSKRSTAWVEGVSGHGEGQGVIILFDAPTDLTTVELINGYAKNADIYAKNSRVRQVDVSTSLGGNGRIRLIDTDDAQSFRLDLDGPVTWIALTIHSVFPGNRYTDTAISELRLQ